MSLFESVVVVIALVLLACLTGVLVYVGVSAVRDSKRFEEDAHDLEKSALRLELRATRLHLNLVYDVLQDVVSEQARSSRPGRTDADSSGEPQQADVRVPVPTPEPSVDSRKEPEFQQSTPSSRQRGDSLARSQSASLNDEPSGGPKQQSTRQQSQTGQR